MQEEKILAQDVNIASMELMDENEVQFHDNIRLLNCNKDTYAIIAEGNEKDSNSEKYSVESTSRKVHPIYSSQCGRTEL